ncbi:hypothetical protein F5Y11DRAFT_364483 [Daldinia sp. FL1419]|nr:hypothetical protein F5Y11DRAFT_364483 [Daldinia sp. FL1419]
MRAAQMLKSKSRAKDRASVLNLTVKTDFSNEGLELTIPTGMDFTQVASAPPRKVQFDIMTEKISTPKASEAMMNSDWRNNRRNGSGAPLVMPATASVEKTEFQKAGAKNAKKLTIDTTLVNKTAVRRYRDTPIDPDFIHSAPITKKDYETVDDEPGTDGSNSIRYSNNDATLSVLTPNAKTSTIRLEPLTPLTSESFQQFSFLRDHGHGLEDELKFGTNGDAHADESSQKDMMVRVIPIAPPHHKATEDPVFPIAAVKAIKHSKRFTNAAWDGIDQYFERNWTKLKVPHTAGLPTEKLREEYESTRSPEVDAAKDQARFDALISKLQRSSASRINAQSTINVTSSKGLGENMPPSKSVSHNPGSNDLGTKAPRNQGTTLNPKASEFQISSGFGFSHQQNLQSYPPDCSPNSPVKQNSYGTTSSTDSSSGGTRSVTAEDIEKLYAFMIDLKAQMTRIEAGSQQRQSMTATSPIAQFNHIQSIASQLGLSMIPESQSRDTQGPQGFESGPGIWPGAQPMPNDQLSNNASAAFMAPPPLVGIQASQLPIVPPSTSHKPGLGAPDLGRQGFVSLGDPTHLPLHAQAQMVYGPRPVRKPKGPQRLGDVTFTQQQQDYEAYLENKRATDRAYAMQCRERQARRFLRQRALAPTGPQVTAPPKATMAPRATSVPQTTATNAANIF